MKYASVTRIAGYMAITALAFLTLFHLLVIVGLIPFDFIWGGRLNDTSSMLKYEYVSLIVTAIFLFFVLIKMNYIKIGWPSVITKIILWIMSVYFLFNILGNMMSGSDLEKIIFIPTSIILMGCVFILAIDREKAPKDTFK